MSVAIDNDNPKSQMAEAYVQKHRIPELFENMTAALIHAQPGELPFRLTFPHLSAPKKCNFDILK